ncbi:MAG: hypothetical protein K1Y02_16955 [Candidatus Hydrogenedentes bacterium]|nr:hypothetical protein [Candidatus Hydrogenedentota bacterium]
MNLPAPIAKVVTPLFTWWPLENSLQQLVVSKAGSNEQIALVESIERMSVVAERPALRAALWLYIDELDRSHSISQGIEDTTGSYWHGIMHRREGDFGNAHYWFNRVGMHPAMPHGYDPHAFVDEVQRRHKDEPLELIEMQRKEWVALFEWCAK